LDLLVVEEVMVEIKVAARLLPIHKAQGLSYLKTIARQVGLIFNFGSPAPEFDRLWFDPTRRTPYVATDRSVPQLSPDCLYP
jgi:uncharacterized membrane protein (UPF0127 family)